MADGVLIACGEQEYIAIDLWKVTRGVKVLAYFLTHMHADHTKGLSNTWSGGKIYCSPETKELLHHKWPELNVPVISLQVGESSTENLTDSSSDRFVTITPLDAQHCLVRTGIME